MTDFVSLPQVLTIAGSDSGGGAGIQADLKTFAAHGCYGASVITALTAQNTQGVTDIFEVSSEFVESQLLTVFDDMNFSAIKTGMLSSAEIIHAIVQVLKRFPPQNLVVDPVMVSKSGHRLLKPEAVEAMKTLLLPIATLITPNLEEAEDLLGKSSFERENLEVVARKLFDKCGVPVLVKGGHLKESADSPDLLFDGSQVYRFDGPRLDGKHTHGTGCTLSAAIASNLALGQSLPDAIQNGKSWLIGAMETAFPVGNGISPVNHLWALENTFQVGD